MDIPDNSSISSKDCRLTRFDLETWDSGRLTVNSAFAELLRQNGYQTFAAVWKHTADAAIAKKLRTDRITLRFSLQDNGCERGFYIKRHVRSSLKEYIKPLLRLTWPILGARNEWKAILDFHEVGLPTMTPVALGESGANSFLITAALENCTKLSELNAAKGTEQFTQDDQRGRLIRDVARIARKMHGAGLHHQDFYLGHLMQSQDNHDTIYVIDLGRVQKHRHLSRRWIVKDLAQLDYSASPSPQERLRFLREYLGRRLTRDDTSLLADIQTKAAAIARHSRKNQL